MRKIKEIIIHCSATKEGRNFTVADIDRWHRERAHCKGHNSISIGICYIGGLSKKGKPKDTRTRDQKAAMRSLIEQLKEEYPLATIHGHNEFANKACPCFDVKKEWGKE